MSQFTPQLLEEVLQTAPEDRRLLEVLLWRGFLVESIDGEVRLCSGIHDDDITVLGEMGLEVHLLAGNAEHVATIALPEGLNPQQIMESIFCFPADNGMTGDSLITKNWNAFKKLQFGAKVPVRHLDPGVALLVKVLPLCGIHTVMSCDGHNKGNATIYFDGPIHFRWAESVVRFIAQQNGFKTQDWSFHNDDTIWTGYQWLLGGGTGCGENPVDQFTFYNRIQAFARFILQPDVAVNVRQAKANAVNPDDFEHALNAAFGN